jgi:hypothetical protein
MIDNPASFEIRTVICFLRAKNMGAAEIQDNGYNVQRWAGEQMFTMKSEVVSLL